MNVEHAAETECPWKTLIFTVIISVQCVFVFPYWVGLANSSALLSLAIFTVPLLVIVQLILIASATSRLLKRPGGSKTNKQRLILGLSVLACVSVFASRATWPVLHKSGFMRRLKTAQFDQYIPAVRQWITETRKPTDDDYLPYDVPRELCPKVVREMNSDYVFLYEDFNGQWLLDVNSGGGNFSWGVVIGPEDTEIPESATMLAPGAYAYTW